MKDNIKIRSNYRPSTNLFFDKGNCGLVEGYIPTSETLDLLDFLLQPVLYSGSGTVRAHLLTGAYGKGKSYSVLIALALLQNTISKDIKENLIEAISKKDLLLANKLSKIGEPGSSKLLPVLVKGGFSSLSLALSSALVNALEENEIDNIVLYSSFSSALEAIKLWKRKYKSAFETFKNIIKEETTLSFNDFLTNLIKHDEKVLKLFMKIYPQITNGSKFIEISEFQVLEDYKKVSKAIVSHGYSGLFIVYDEFSKFLESIKNEMSEGDIKLLQDLAELANSSGMKTQIHLLLISHKIPVSYFNDSHSINEWEAISGRFNIKDIYGNYEQEYEIIEGMLRIDDDYIGRILLEERKIKDYDNLKKSCVRNDMFSDCLFERVARNCYPIHPITLYALPKLSEKIAQNERSIFTFMIAQGPFSLQSFINKSTTSRRLLVSNLYDYFVPTLRTAPSSSLLARLYLMVETISNRLVSTLAKDIAKSIAILILLNDDKLKPNFESIRMVYMLTGISSIELEKANSQLLLDGVIRESEGKKEYLPLIIDPKIQTRVKYLTNIEKKDIDLSFDLKKYGLLNVFYPRRYNDENSITRFFEMEIITDNNFSSMKNLYKNHSKDGYGTVFVLLSDSKNFKEKVILESKNFDLSFVIAPKRPIDVNQLIYILAEYKALKKMIEKNKQSSLSEMTILNYLLDDDYYSLKELLSILSDPFDGGVDCFVKGDSYFLKNKNAISLLCSFLYEENLGSTLIFNREDINLDFPAPVSIKSRDIIVNNILNNNINNLSKYKESSQVYSMFSSLCFYSNIFKFKENGVIKLDLENAKNNFEKPIKYLKDCFIESSKKPYPISQMMEKLRSVEGNIGVKKGLIPILFSLAIAQFPNKLIFHRKQQECIISGAFLESILKDSSDCVVEMKGWNEDYQQYLDLLCKRFKVNPDSTEVLFNLSIAIRKWWQSLPIQTKAINGYFSSNGKVTFFGKKEILLIKLFNSNNNNNNPYQLFMSKIPKRFSKREQPDLELSRNILGTINNINMGITKSIEGIKNYICCKLKLEFSTGDNWLISMHQWVDKYNIKNIQNASKKTQKIFNLVSKAKDEEELFFQLTTFLVGLRFNDWSEGSIELLNQTLSVLILDLEKSIHLTTKANDSEKALVKMIDSEGKLIEKEFAMVETSELGRMVSDEITSIVEEMGQSLSREEFNNILLRIVFNS
ncbi:MAG: hypothetical protein WC162_00125 [Sphaerochaetaceae bacterium]